MSNEYLARAEEIYTRAYADGQLSVLMAVQHMLGRELTASEKALVRAAAFDAVKLGVDARKEACE